jgi:spoIIIJ-associated protein
VEWVETTGRSVDEAKEAALDELGVDEQDAEFEIVEEPRPGLFGRMRGEARVRARVAPTQPRPKVERRERRRRGDSRSSRDGKGAGAPRAGGNGRRTGTSDAAAETSKAGGGAAAAGAVATAVDAVEPPDAPAPSPETHRTTERPGGPMTTDLEPAEQATAVADFLDGLLDAFGLDGDVATELVDDDAVEVTVAGDDLGLLIGPKGTTLNAVQELSRTVVQRRATSPTRVRVDVGGYRERRRAALARFTEQVAAEVIESGASRALEPMSPADRKVVHDTANEIEGVSTVSEGEEPRRRVVIVPAS